jgi:hypothetical protein
MMLTDNVYNLMLRESGFTEEQTRAILAVMRMMQDTQPPRFPARVMPLPKN